jgi:hypothetical protein
MALTTGRVPSQRGDVDYAVQYVPMAAGVTILQGAMVDKNAAGFYKAAATNTTDTTQGIATQTKTNAGADGATFIEIAYGIFNMRNSSAGEAIVAADIGKPCFAVDDDTVAKTNGTNTRHAAGEVWDVRPDGSVDVHFKP